MVKMLRMVAFILFITSCRTFAHVHDAIINLGGDCQITYQLQIHGLRKYALPFDWLITPYHSLRALLEHNFEGFLAPDNFQFFVNEKNEKYILDKKYGTRFIHDFKLQEDFLQDYENIAQKYVRRINRFNNLILTSQSPLFMRKRITKEQAIELRNVLAVTRQGKPFLLVVMDTTPEMIPDWQLPALRNFYLRQLQPYSWKGDPKAWKEIFQELDLEITETPPSGHAE
jgi:hypothetical protein